MRSASLLFVALLALGCEAAPARDAGVDGGPDECAALFGMPGPNTGLDETECRPSCACGGVSFEACTWDAAALDALRAFTLAEPFSELTTDPYAAPAPPPPPAGTTCAALVAPDRSYRLATYPSRDAALAAGAVPTHDGACGVCSPLADLAVYAGTPDLTAPVRQCGLDHLADFAGLVACLEALGFTRPCAQIWAYNTEHTRAACGAVCVRLLRAPYHLPDGGLNACLLCDETRSGPVFKAIAGRTRRNSGLANAMCRPCAEVVPFTHAYGP